MKIIEKTCGRVCPVIAEKDHEIACLKAKLSLAEDALELNGRLLEKAYDSIQSRDVRINQLIEGKHENERRIAKARQALFGIIDVKVIGGP